jgi:hypothetical protein
MKLTWPEFWFGIFASFGLCLFIIVLQMVHVH